MGEIWPRLKRKLVCDARRKKKTSSRLEKLAALLKGVHSKSSLVEKTGASVSAARSLSRSTQEWAARTLSGSKSLEVVLLQSSAVSQTRSSEYTERLSCAEARFNPRAEEEQSEATVSVERNLSEDCRQSPPAEPTALPPLRRPARCVKKSSAFVVLLALGAFISRKIKNSLAAALTFNTVVLRVWRRGRLVFSSVALYFLTPLRSYLTYGPRRLSPPHLSSQNPDSSLVLPLEPPPAATSAAPLSLLLTIPETPPDSPPASSSSTEPTASGDSRRVVKKVSSRFKKLKMFRSSSSSSSPSSPSEPGSPVSSPTSPLPPRLHIPSESGDEESKKSRLSRMSSAETLEIGEMTASDATTSPRTSVSWPVVGLLVTLLFLVVGRVPAIMATSLFLVVVSNAQHDRAHPRRSRRASEGARKPQQPGSPPRRR